MVSNNHNLHCLEMQSRPGIDDWAPLRQVKLLAGSGLAGAPTSSGPKPPQEEEQDAFPRSLSAWTRRRSLWQFLQPRLGPFVCLLEVTVVSAEYRKHVTDVQLFSIAASRDDPPSKCLIALVSICRDGEVKRLAIGREDGYSVMHEDEAAFTTSKADGSGSEPPTDVKAPYRRDESPDGPRRASNGSATRRKFLVNRTRHTRA
ncbi:hypothetical protein BU25DRAFT_458735 [Macroventuria anomochaeta]|uniref:Uncharacterized protein n=1 Tax=Macroventuria anomochaeta TaxID=301207 RepID=A0ACB6S1Z0_9PLEO|nr:uncharacterized protein BU25DRAFT_458735 [Macroventuria anomochaeta]KAF2627404.1 hypothetical protein BU25DRAFT_458735 [Macroventuria anomochaeta]